MNYTFEFLQESIEILKEINVSEVDNLARVLSDVKEREGRIFFAGSGGGAGHSSHAAADFRKLGQIECYSITDNISELTARVNDVGWKTSYSEWLKVSRMNNKDCLFVFSVGGGDSELEISTNLVDAIDYAKRVGASVGGVVGRNGGHLREKAEASILIPTKNPENVTTQVEGFQALMWHLLVCHPFLNSQRPKWESTAK